MPESLRFQPLARRYRPTRFAGDGGLVGQPHVVRTLSNAVQAGQLANAYLFTGPRGTGKTTAARLLAAALNCGERAADAEPCGRCDSCVRILGGRESNDVIEIDAATHRGAEDARALRQQAMYAASSASAWRVYILDEAHMLTKEAWSALLKVLEEPPSRVLFLFCTTEPQKIEQAAPAILSRCQRLDMRRLTPAALVQEMARLAKLEGVDVEEEALALLARRANGGMRDALSMLDQLRSFEGDGAITAHSVRDAFGMQPERTYLAILDLVARSERGRVFDLVRHLETSGADFVRFVEDWQDALAAMAMVQEGGSPEGWSPEAQAALSRKAGLEPPGGEALIGTAVLVELIALCQADGALLRQASRPATLVLTLLQRSITLVEAAGAGT